MARPSDGDSGTGKRKHQNTLEDDILATGPLRQKAKKIRARREDETGHNFIDSKASRRILKIGRELVEEDEQTSRPEPESTNAFALDSRFVDEPVRLGEDPVTYDDEDAWGSDDEVVEEEEVNPSDLALFNKFLPPGEQPTLDLSTIGQPREDQETNLADIILQKIEAHEAAQAGGPQRIMGGGAPEYAVEIPEKVMEVYSKVGMLLSTYKSGKLPKPFKILPGLPLWEDFLAITRPENWTANACEEATRIFISANPYVAQTFMTTVILERVRDDLREPKKLKPGEKQLNHHLFEALMKATYKPAAFFKGFLLPFVESGCTLQEARIISRVLTRASIPLLHSAAALLKLTELAAEQASMLSEGGGATNIFIMALLKKRYALPYKVIDALVFHFLRFRTPKAADPNDMAVDSNPVINYKLPVLWHQCLLAFAQRYRDDITEDQRESLLDLLLDHGHKDIGPEVRRELLAGRGRGMVLEQTQAIVGGDDTMID